MGVLKMAQIAPLCRMNGAQKEKFSPFKFLKQDVEIFLDRFLEKFAFKDWKAENYNVKAVSKDMVKTIDEGDLIDLGDMQLKVNSTSLKVKI